MRAHLASLVNDFRAHPGERAVVLHTGVRTLPATYGSLATLAGRVAAELVRRRITPGDRVILWGANSAEWIAAFFGCLLRGVLIVPLDAAGSNAFVERVITDTAPKLIFADEALLATLTTPIPTIAFATFEAKLPAEPNFTVDPSVQLDAPFQIVFTSGTTAEPKGIVHTHRNVLASLTPIESEIAKYRRYERWFHPLRFLHTLPLSHVFGQFMGLWIPAILAAELHFANDLQPSRTIALIRRERISVLVAVPRVLGLLRTHLLERDPTLSARLEAAAKLPAHKRWWLFRRIHLAFGLKFWAVISGGAALPVELETFFNRLGFALIQGYGMTETSALVTLNHPFRIGQGTIGKPLPGREVRLSDTGEILVRGETVSSATWRNGRMEQRQEEWLATGDLAEQTAAGDLRFLGRKGDAIVTSSGLNIYPSDIESALLQQPGVRACAVVPCNTAAGIEPITVVVFAGDQPGLEQAIAAANTHLADFQQIRRTLRWPQLDFPYTSTGKLLRRQIAAWACATIANAGPARETEDPILGMITAITGAQPASTGDSLRLSEDLFLDSLGRVQLAASIEQRLGIELPEDTLATLNTLGDLRRALSPAQTEGHPERMGSASGSPESKDSESLSQQQAAFAPETQTPHLYPHWPWTLPPRILRTLVLEAITRPLIAIFLNPRIVPPAQPLPDGPFLVIANHVTSLDGALVLYALPPRLRHRLAVAMSGEMLLDFRLRRNQPNAVAGLFAPAAYWLLTLLFNVFPLPRLRGFQRSFSHAGQALDSGQSVLIFPEGTRNRSETILAPFRPGIGLLATEASVPVLPVALAGMPILHTGLRNWFRSGRLAVRIGPPITLPAIATPAEWTAELEAAMRSLLAETCTLNK